MAYPTSRSLVLLGVWGLLAWGGIPGDTADFRRATGPRPTSCPAGWALDRVRAQCHRCPAGFDRVAVAPDFMGCWKPAGATHSRPQKRNRATGLIGTDCPAGQFAHVDLLCPTCPKNCYECPRGAIRTGAPLTSREACMLPVPPQPAALQVRNACPTNAFRDIGRGDCWSCDGWIRTAAPVTSENACTSDVTGILGVDPGAICTGLLGAIESGGKMGAETEAAINALMGPVLKPINDAMNVVTGQFRRPAEFDRLLNRMAAPLRADPRLRDELPDLAGRLMAARDRLVRVLLDPAVMCGGDLARAGSEMNALDLWPRAWRRQPVADRIAFNLLRRPLTPVELDASATQDPQPYVVYALEGSLNTGYGVGPVVALSLLVDGRGPVALLLSGGASVSPPQPATGGLSFTVLFFPSAALTDFVEVDNLGVQLNVEIGDLLGKALFGQSSAAGPMDRFQADLDFVVSLDPTFQSDGGVPAGIGLSTGLRMKLRRPAVSKSVSEASDMTSVTSNAEWSRKGAAGQMALNILKKLNLSGDWTWKVASLRAP